LLNYADLSGFFITYGEFIPQVAYAGIEMEKDLTPFSSNPGAKPLVHTNP